MAPGDRRLVTDDPRRRIPGVDRLLSSEAFRPLRSRWGDVPTTRATRAELDDVRKRLAEPGIRSGRGSLEDGSPSPGALEDPSWYAERVKRRLEAEDRPSLRRVINATGVVLHTNLGRAPLAAAAREAMRRAATGYSNLEFDLDEGSRGSRYDHCRDLVRELVGSDDALVVNNCAAALVLVLNTVARDGRVLVSRGELVEIGGGFRIPEMLDRAGARLVEVGSTNRTRVEDYAAAAEEAPVAAILKVHRSNFRIRGFTGEATLSGLAPLAGELGVPLIHDLGSGLLAEPSSLGLPPEPTPAGSVRAGADLVCFSADKLLGGPQAGIVVGGAEEVERLRRSPLCRAVRVDKVTLAGLEATLRLYREPSRALAEIPALAALAASEQEVRARAEETAGRMQGSGRTGPAEWTGDTSHGFTVRVRPSVAVVGGGTYPGVEVASWSVRIAPGDDGPAAGTVAAALRRRALPVVARVEDGDVVCDLRTVLPEETDALVEALRETLVPGSGGGREP